jgi:ribosomal-protein-alanine N-acetyltransferase
MRSSDLDRLVVIDSTASLFPWSRAKFIESFKPHAPCFVLERGKDILGYAIYSQVLDEASLLNIAIEPSQRQQGSGSLLLEQSLAVIQPGASCCFLEVRQSNITARALYGKADFVQVGVRRDYYPAVNGREDAIVMRKDF